MLSPVTCESRDNGAVVTVNLLGPGFDQKHEQKDTNFCFVKDEEEEEEEEEEMEERWDGGKRTRSQAELILGVFRDRFRNFSFLKYLWTFFPIINWLPRYQWKKDLPYDGMSGLIVAVMHIPQGMAYAMLAGVDPVVGIYTAFIPVLVYVILGNMPHVSMGTFAVVSILVSGPVLRLGSEEGEEGEFSRLQVATALTLCVGIIQVLLGLLRLGSLSILLTDCLVSAFTVGASFHVFTSQIKHVLGLNLPTISGAGRLVKTYIALGQHLTETNLVSLVISAVCIILLLVCDQAVAPYIKKNCCKFPIPIQLFLVLGFTGVSQLLQLSKEYGVRTISDIGEIPLGIPAPTLPLAELIPLVFVDAIPIAIIAFTIGQGLGKMFGAEHGYTVPPNQELVAQGVSNLCGSFFSCLPMAGSLSRSLVQNGSGCRSPVTGVISAGLLLLVLLFLGPFFQPLPICVLASIIISSLTGMFKKVSDISIYWERSVPDGILWTVTFLATVFVDVATGLAVGIALSFVMTMFQGCLPKVSLRSTDHVLQVRGPLNYLNLSMAKVLIESRVMGRPGKGLHNGACLKVEEGETPRSEDELLDGGEGDVGLLLDLTYLTHMDLEGAGLVPWLESYLKACNGPYRRLRGVVATGATRERLAQGSTPVYPTILVAKASLNTQGNNSGHQVT